MGRDFLVPRDKGTEVISLSWEKETTGQIPSLSPGLIVPGQRDNRAISNSYYRTGWEGGFDILPQDIPGFLLPPLFLDKATLGQGNFLGQ